MKTATTATPPAQPPERALDAASRTATITESHSAEIFYNYPDAATAGGWTRRREPGVLLRGELKAGVPVSALAGGLAVTREVTPNCWTFHKGRIEAGARFQEENA